MQCGCECTKCTVTDEAGNVEESTDSTVCNAVFKDENEFPKIDCKSRNDTNCAAEFSNDQQVPWCAIKQPSKFPPLYDLSYGVNFTLSDGSGPRDVGNSAEDSSNTPGQQGGSSGESSSGAQSQSDDEKKAELLAEPISGESKFMYTGQSAFAEKAMDRFVRQVPDVELLGTDPNVATAVEVCCSLAATPTDSAAQVVTRAFSSIYLNTS
jgi:hypothetical protein